MYRWWDRVTLLQFHDWTAAKARRGFESGIHIFSIKIYGKYFYLLLNSRAAASTSLFGPHYHPSSGYLLSSMIMRAQLRRDCIVLTDTSATPLDTMKRC